MKKRLIFTMMLLLLVWGSSLSVAFAQTRLTPEPPIIIDPPMLPPWGMEGLTIAYQRVDVRIENQVATTHIDQLFVNDNDWMLEGTYLFPLPAGATVSQLTMWVDGQPIEAKILEREEARQIYDAIVRQLRDPALLEYIGSSAIQANVFPIPPRDQRRIEIEYTQVLAAENGLIHYVYPQSTDLYTNTPLDRQSIRVEVRSNEAIRAIYSPSHAVAIDRDGDFGAVVGFEAAEVTADKDFELYYTVSPEDIGLSLLTFREPGQDGFFLMLVAPGVEADDVVAKDVILVIDVSGSMAGEKMEQARQAALYVVEHLNLEDRFNIIAFSTSTRHFAPALRPAAETGAIRPSHAFINGLEAIGGTDISQALLEAAGQADPERPTTIIFLTDGVATEGIIETPLLLDSVQQAMPANARIFAFGVGDDVDTTLLDSLAQNHRGATTYVRPFQAIDEIVGSFYAKISAPVLADISLDVEGVTVEQMYPQTLPDLFAGSQLALVGRYREGGPATIILRGSVNGQEQNFTYGDNVFRSRDGESFIPRLWATRAIGHLLTEIRLHGENAELVQSIVNLSIRYGIITPYTSYLIEEDDIFSQTARDAIAGEVLNEMAEATRLTSGERAVEESVVTGDMANAPAPMALPTSVALAGGFAGESLNVGEVVRLAGAKTFLLRDGVWMDTAFDPDRQTPQQITFASDAYFELLSAAPELGQYLALGQRVLVVYEDQAYEIVGSEGEATVTAPASSRSGPDPVATTAPGVTPAGNSPAPGAGICTAALALPLLLVVGMIGMGYGRKRKR